MYRAQLNVALQGAQWTGITTRLAERLLETNAVEAVLTMASSEEDSWKPEPILITKASEIANCRGMKMGFAPLLALLDEAHARGYRRLAVIGIPCQVYALRSIEQQENIEQQFDKLYVIGTPCSDNTTTERFHEFLKLIDATPERITYLEFRADYHVEVRYVDGTKREIPFLKLPLSKLPSDFFPTTCRTCVDYTNSLSDITVGYMGGHGQQWLIVRNARGAELLDLLGDEVELSKPGSAGRRRGAVMGFKRNIERSSGGLPIRAMPDWLRPIVAWLMPRVGPRGLEFARARVEMKALEAITVLRHGPHRRIKSMIPKHIWDLVAPYDEHPRAQELPGRESSTTLENRPK
jgi:coenzyme F420 hydrogenase subunit beta